jgi:uncharacterized protein (TIGR02231 family)
MNIRAAALPFSLAFLVLAPAEAAQILATSTMNAVTVYPRGAEVLRSIPVRLEAGAHTIILNNLPPRLVASSIRVSGKSDGALAIGSVDNRLILAPDAVLNASERQKILDRIEALGDERTALDAIINAAMTQQELITNLAQLPLQAPPRATDNTVSPDWESLLDLIASRLQPLNEKVQKSRIRQRGIDKEIKKLRKKLEQQPGQRERRMEVSIHVSAATALSGSLELRYQVREASWRPLYDARLETGGGGKAPELELVRRASISQRSGEDWSNVRLTLSTTRPQQNTAAPRPRSLLIDFEPPRPKMVVAPAPVMDTRRKMKLAVRRAPAKAMAEAEVMGRITEAEAVIEKAAFQARYTIPGTVSIARTGAIKKVRITATKIAPELKIRAVPWIDTVAYLQAGFTLKGTPLLPGKVLLYRDGVYTGAGRMPLLHDGAKHSLGFGPDDGVRVTRIETSRSKGEWGLIKTATTDEQHYLITVKNLHDQPMKVTVIDRLPVAQNEDIKVERLPSTTKPSRTDVKDRPGILAWDLDMKAGETRKIHLDYKISWPTDKKIYTHER